MKALKVFESLDFERGKDPINVMDIGIKSWLQNFDTNYFKLGLNGEREEAKEKFNNIMFTIKFEEIKVNTEYFAFEMLFGQQNEKDYRQFKLDHDLYLSYKDTSNVPSAIITDEKGRSIAANYSTSVGSKGVNTLLERVRKTKRIKFPKSSK